MVIKAVVLDINGTVFDGAKAAESTFQDLGVDTNDITLWFTEVLRDAFAAQLSGVFVPFKDFAGYHLMRRMPSIGVSQASSLDAAASAGGKLAEAWAAAEPFPDVFPALNQLQLAGITVSALTNGSTEISRKVLEKSGLAMDEVLVFDINEALAWKPSKTAYQFVCNALLLSPGEVMMVAAHPWDCNGAMQAGMKAAYVQRDPHEPYPQFLDKPQLIVKDFGELAEKLLK